MAAQAAMAATTVVMTIDTESTTHPLPWLELTTGSPDKRTASERLPGYEP